MQFPESSERMESRKAEVVIMLNKIPSLPHSSFSGPSACGERRKAPLMLLYMPKHPMAACINFISLVRSHVRPTTGLKMAPAGPPVRGQMVGLRVQAQHE